MQEEDKREVKAKDVVKDLRLGLSDAELMEKYRLTSRGLLSLFKKLLDADAIKPEEIYGRSSSFDETVSLEIPVPKPRPKPWIPSPRRRVKAKDIVSDLRAGMPDSKLTEKYKLSSKALQSLFEKLIEADAISRREVENRSASYDETVAIESLRAIPRNYLAFPIPVYRVDDLGAKGHIHDITELGAQIWGLDVAVDDLVAFLVQADEFADIYPFVFEARCIWVKTEGERGDPMAGFEIIDISRGSLAELRKLIQSLTFSD